jgi:hypothetical protein
MALQTLPPTLGEPTPYMYTYLNTYVHKYNIKHTHTPLSQTTKHGALLPRAASDGADFSSHKKHASLTHIQFTHKHEFMWEVHNTRLLSHNNPLFAAPCVDNSPATATWWITAPRCRASDKTGTIPPYNCSSLCYNDTT